MKVLISLGIVITLSLIGGSIEARAAGCEAISNVRFICDQLARIMQDEEKLYDGCGNKRAIHVANRCRDKLHRVSAERHSRHDRRYAASL